MESDSSLASIALAVSLVCFAVATLVEAGIASVRREQIPNLLSKGVSGSTALQRLQTLPMGPTGSIAAIRSLSLSGAIVSVSALVITQIGVRWALIAIVSIALLVVLAVVSSLASRLASTKGERIALVAAGPSRALAWLLNPFLTIQAYVSSFSHRVRTNGTESGLELVPTEINLPLDSAGEPLDDREVRMILGVVRQDKTVAREIMVPRVDMIAVASNTPVVELAERMVTGGHSRIPVFNDDLDHIEGIAYARDILNYLVQDQETSGILAENVLRPALFIPESKTLEELLNEFQQRRMQMAIVVDEYGGVSGLVTIEDLLEEIVGEIQDEFDLGEPEIEPVSDAEFVMDARVGIEQLKELLNVSIEGDGFDTLGGFVYQRLGKIPSQGDTVNYNGLNIEVISTVGRRLERLRVKMLVEHSTEQS
jgi:CBS domain containing-hemolysin-like protein